MAWGWGHGTTVCVVLSAAEREQLAAIVADCNRPRKHGERAPHRGCLGRSALGAAGGAKHRRQSADGVAVATTLRRESGVEGLLRDKTRKPGKAPIAAETTARVVGIDPRFREGRLCAAPPHQATDCTGRAMPNHEARLQRHGTTTLFATLSVLDGATATSNSSAFSMGSSARSRSAR